MTVTHAAWQNPSSAIGFMAIIKPDSVSAYQHFMNKDTSGTTGHWLRINSDGKPEASFRLGGVSRAVVGATSLSAGGVYIIEGGWSLSDGRIRLYVNGSLASSNVWSGGLAAPTDNLQFGRNGSTLFPYTGEMQHAAIFPDRPTNTTAMARAVAAGLA